MSSDKSDSEEIANERKKKIPQPPPVSMPPPATSTTNNTAKKLHKVVTNKRPNNETSKKVQEIVENAKAKKPEKKKEDIFARITAARQKAAEKAGIRKKAMEITSGLMHPTSSSHGTEPPTKPSSSEGCSGESPSTSKPLPKPSSPPKTQSQESHPLPLSQASTASTGVNFESPLKSLLKSPPESILKSPALKSRNHLLDAGVSNTKISSGPIQQSEFPVDDEPTNKSSFYNKASTPRNNETESWVDGSVFQLLDDRMIDPWSDLSTPRSECVDDTTRATPAASDNESSNSHVRVLLPSKKTPGGISDPTISY